MYFRQDALDQVSPTESSLFSMMLTILQKLAVLDTSFDKLQTRAEAFNALQTIQSETQDRLHKQVQKAMQVTSQRLALIDASASNVGSKLKDISSVLRQVAALGNILGSWARWRWPCIVIAILFVFDRKMAFYTAAILSELSEHLLDDQTNPFLASLFFIIDSLPSVPSDMVLIHYASGYQLKVASLLKTGGVITFLCTILLVIRTAGSRSLSHIISRWWSTSSTGIFKAPPSHTAWSI